ncbi:MAG: hypothetical protein KKE77_02655 [Alphaproteobacteria bacterium]|nr:hypothetical protein [Alphaproteobacteria bacterium]MBU2340128.1 hypothetical protein [Alphaproteobacteria bacterium]
MPLRVLDLVSQLGLSPERIAIERGADRQFIDACLQVTDRQGELLVQKLRSMVLVRSATLLPMEEPAPLVQALQG